MGDIQVEVFLLLKKIGVDKLCEKLDIWFSEILLEVMIDEYDDEEGK